MLNTAHTTDAKADIMHSPQEPFHLVALHARQRRAAAEQWARLLQGQEQDLTEVQRLTVWTDRGRRLFRRSARRDSTGPALQNPTVSHS
jgi:hypothetical protein